MALISCAECGKQVSDQATTCPGCGAPIPANAGPKPHPGAPPRAEQRRGRGEPVESRGSGRGWIVAAVVVVVLAGAGVAAYRQFVILPERKRGDDVTDKFIQDQKRQEEWLKTPEAREEIAAQQLGRPVPDRVVEAKKRFFAKP